MQASLAWLRHLRLVVLNFWAGSCERGDGPPEDVCEAALTALQDAGADPSVRVAWDESALDRHNGTQERCPLKELLPYSQPLEVLWDEVGAFGEECTVP